MISLEKKVFGNITLKEVIGAIPAIDEFQKLLGSQFAILKKELENKNRDELKSLLENQIRVEKETNSRPGAMALDQYKIRLFVDFSQKYTSEIRKKLDS